MMVRKIGSAIGALSKATPPSGAVRAKEPLRLIGGSRSASASGTVTAWEAARPGDYILLFAQRTDGTGVISTPSGFTSIVSASGSAERVTAFYAFVGADGSLPSVTATGAQTISWLVYRGASGHGVSASNVEASSTSHSVPATGITAGSLVACADAYSSDITGPQTSSSGVATHGYVAPPGARFAATTLGPYTSGTLTLGFILSVSRPEVAVIVEILPL